MTNRLLILLATTAVAVLQSGCVIPRCPFGLSSKDYPIVPVAVLPVEVSPRVSEEDYAHEDLRELGNQVLDTLTKSADDNLIGPELVKTRLAGEELPDTLRWLDVHGEMEITPSTLAEFQDFSKRLGADHVIRSSLAIIGRAPEAVADTYSAGASWEVEVSIRMDLVDLETGFVRRRASGKGDAGGVAGVIALIPVYLDNTLGKGIDQAFRAAFKNMYRAKDEDPPQEGRAIVPFETP